MRLTIFLALSILILLFDRNPVRFSAFRISISTLVTPLQYLVDAPFSFINWLQVSLVSQKTLIQENAHLKAQQLLLRGRVQQIISLEKENWQLRALLQSSPRRGQKLQIAQLLAVDSDAGGVQEVILDKGSRNKIFINQPVLDANGVMGQVIQITPFTSRVLLITDRRSAVPVEDSHSGLRAIANGMGNNGLLELANIPPSTEIKVGDIFVTSGLGQRFPAGYPLGIVRQVNKDPSSDFAQIIIEPAAHIDRSRLVLLVWPDFASNNVSINKTKVENNQSWNDATLEGASEPAVVE